MRSLILFGLIGAVAALPFESDSTKAANALLPRSARLTSNIASLKRMSGSKTPSTKYLHSLLEYGQANLIEAEIGEIFIANVSFGSQQFEAVIDTGSSDTWLAETGFTCVNQTNNDTVSEATCLFGSSYTPDSSFTQIPDENFNISYADGEYLNGIVGYDTVTFSGIVVPHQEVALAYLAAWDGDGISSGLVGLAFPKLTSSYSGNNASADQAANATSSANNSITYSSIINTIFFVENLTAPLFSLALSRDESNTSFGGIIAIGGIADPANPVINSSTEFAVTPIEILTAQFIDPNTPEYQFYTITVEALVFDNASLVEYDNTPTQFIVDSGTTLNYVPTVDAAIFNALFAPPALNIEGNYYVECNATVPDFSIAIGDQIFLTNPLDLVLDIEDGDICLSGVQDGGTGPYILGDVFLKNVLAVFDVGKLEMQFAAREYYQS